MKRLHVTHHALERLTQYAWASVPDADKLPKTAEDILDGHGAAVVRKALVPLLKMLTASKKVLLPEIQMLFKSLKQGKAETIFFLAPSGIIFNVAQDTPDIDTMVTCTFPESVKRRQLREDPVYPMPAGQYYAGLFEQIDVPYRLSKHPRDLEWLARFGGQLGHIPLADRQIPLVFK